MLISPADSSPDSPSSTALRLPHIAASRSWSSSSGGTGTVLAKHDSSRSSGRAWSLPWAASASNDSSQVAITLARSSSPRPISSANRADKARS